MTQNNNGCQPNASAWNNGNPDYNSGAGLGLHIFTNYEKNIFGKKFETIDLYYNGELIAKDVNVTDKNCPELISSEIGKWLIDNGWHDWPDGKPYKFKLSQRGNTNEFDIIHCP